MNEADDLIALYRSVATDRPAAAVDDAVLGAARLAAWRRRHAPALMAGLAALAVLAMLAAMRSEPAHPQSAAAQSYGMREGSARAMLADARALQESIQSARPGFSDRPKSPTSWKRGLP